MNRLREQRLFLKEQRQFYETARSEADRIIRNRGSLQDLDQVPLLQEGEPTSKNTIRNIWKQLLTKAGLRNMRFHDIRHTFASLLLNKGKSPVYLKEQLGHSSIQMTVDIYGHLIPNSNRNAINSLDELSLDEDNLTIGKNKLYLT